MQFFRSKWSPLFFSNFLGVFNDNFLKYCIIFIGVGWSMPSWLTQSQLISIVSASLIIPYLILSPLGGRFAVIYSKISVFRFFKLIELPIMLLASIAFYFHWVILAVFAVLLMGIQSCLYSPSKYSLIRDIGGPEGVSYGSGVFEMMAFLGILLATIVAAIVADYYHNWLVAGIFLGVALFGYLVTRQIKAVELPENKVETETLNPFSFILYSYRFAHQKPDVNLAVFGASSFWLIGGMLQMNLVIHSEHVYHASYTTTGLVMACAAIGIAFGTWAAGKISGKTVKKGLILVGILSMSFFFAILTFFYVPFFVYILLVFCAAFAGGFFQIPNLSMLQNANLGRKLGSIIGYLNLITFIFVLLGTAFFSIITYLTSENSYAVFGALFAISLSVSFVYFRKSSDYWKQTKALFKHNPAN